MTQISAKSTSASPKRIRFVVGRSEISGSVLITENHEFVEFPTFLLPKGLKEGNILSLDIHQDFDSEKQEWEKFSSLQQKIFEEAENNYVQHSSPTRPCEKEERDDISEILPSSLFLSGMETVFQVDVVKKYHIKFILEISCEESIFSDANQKHTNSSLPFFQSALNVQKKHLRFSPSPIHSNFSQYFEEVYDFIQQGHKSHRAVLVMSEEGVNLAPCFVISFLMKRKNLRLVDAFYHVKKMRPNVAPSFHLVSQLQSYETLLFGLKESAFLARYVKDTMSGWDMDLEILRKTLERFDNNVNETIDFLCRPSSSLSPSNSSPKSLAPLASLSPLAQKRSLPLSSPDKLPQPLSSPKLSLPFIAPPQD